MFLKVHILFVGAKIQYMMQGSKDDADDRISKARVWDGGEEGAECGNHSLKSNRS